MYNNIVSKFKDVREDTEDLVLLYQEKKDKETLNKILYKVIGLINKEANVICKNKNNLIDFEDVQSHCMITFMKSVENFKYSKKMKFSTYLKNNINYYSTRFFLAEDKFYNNNLLVGEVRDKFDNNNNKNYLVRGNEENKKNKKSIVTKGATTLYNDKSFSDVDINLDIIKIFDLSNINVFDKEFLIDYYGLFNNKRLSIDDLVSKLNISKKAIYSKRDKILDKIKKEMEAYDD